MCVCHLILESNSKCHSKLRFSFPPCLWLTVGRGGWLLLCPPSPCTSAASGPSRVEALAFDGTYPPSSSQGLGRSPLGSIAFIRCRCFHHWSPGTTSLQPLTFLRWEYSYATYDPLFCCHGLFQPVDFSLYPSPALCPPSEGHY